MPGRSGALACEVLDLFRQRVGGREPGEQIRLDGQRPEGDGDGYVVIRPVLDPEGGTLLIGVADDGQVLGIEPDLRTLGPKRK